MVRRRRLVRAWTLLAALGGLAACVADTGGPGYGRPAAVGTVPPVASGAPRQHVTILLPLTGSTAEIGQAMLRAAQLSLDQPGAPPLDARDTKGTPAGAAEAAKLAIAAGSGMVLGPLTAGETAAVAPLTKAAGIPVLAFTSDASLAQPGVWTLGITPAQQVRRLVLAAQTEGRSRVAAVLPSNAFGDAMASGVAAAAGATGLAAPSMQRYGSNFAALNAALKNVSDYDARRGAAEQQDAPSPDDADTRRRPKESGRPLPPPPFDTFLLGAAGEQLGQALPLLTFYGIGPEQVRILGPALWSRDAARLSALSGAWYAAPDPAQRAQFEQAYAAKYNAPPRDLASLAYDAAGVARVAADSGGFTPGALTRPEGFTGADGLLGLQPDGQARRGLAIFEIDHGGSHVVQPAPQSLQSPGV